MRPITAKRRRSPSKQTAVSGSLALMTNIVMAWSAHVMQQRINGLKRSLGRRIDAAIWRTAHPLPPATSKRSRSELHGYEQQEFVPRQTSVIT